MFCCLTLLPVSGGGGASVGADSPAEGTARAEELFLFGWFFLNLFLNFGCTSWQIAEEERA